MDESVIDAMRAAVHADPSNTALLEHLATLLVSAGQNEEAWTYASEGVRLDPANVGLLRVAAEAGAQAGHLEEASRYRELLSALQAHEAGKDQEPLTTLGTSNPVESAERSAVPDSVDDLIDIWDQVGPAPEPTVGQIHRDRLLLKDVGGMQHVKDRLNASLLAPMRNPELQAAFGMSMRGGLLLWGPPGCGKTFIARAVAGELDANFYAVGLSDVLDMWIGSSERNVSSIFDTARRNAPCVLFLDEIDALGQQRAQLRGGSSAMRGVVNQLLQELDGATSDNSGVFVLAATNHPWDIDSALLRPKRLDRSLLVLPPDLPARIAILELHLRGRPTENIDFAKCAKLTSGLSGADLGLVAETATELAFEASSKSGTVEPITMRHLRKAIKTIEPSYKPWIESARNYATFNNESGRYDELLSWLQGK